MKNYRYWLYVFLIGGISGMLSRIFEILLFLITHYGYGEDGVNTVWQEAIYLLTNDRWHIFNLTDRLFLILFISVILNYISYDYIISLKKEATK